MANPKLEGGFTRIANEIMDNLARTRIPGEARQVLDFIIRQTYGWRHDAHAINLTQFSEGTGLSKVHVARAISRLLAMNLIIITQKGNDSLPKKVTDAKLYEFNKDYESWRSLPKKVTLPKKVKVVTQKGNDSLPKKVTTVTQKGNGFPREPAPEGDPQRPKERKERLKKRACRNTFLPNAPAYRLAALLFDEIIKANPLSRLRALKASARESKIQDWAADVDDLIVLDKQEPSTVEEVMKFAVHDDFWGANILSASALRKNWDRLTKEMQRRGRMPKEEHGAPDLEGKRFVVYGGFIQTTGEDGRRYGCWMTPEAVIKRFGVGLSECLIESDRAPLHTKGVDVSKYVALRPQPDGVYDLERVIREQRKGRACA